MKFHRIGKSVTSSICLFALMSSTGHAGVVRPTVVNVPGKFYVGAFGGYGSSKHFDISQFGTAYYSEAAGGPLAVDAFGSTNNRSTGFVGLHVGFQGGLVQLSPQWTLLPAIELEGYYLGNNSFTGHLINDEATRLDEHDFIVNYPMRTGVFLTNAVLSLNVPCLYGFRPYLGVGFGGAVASIRNASARQLSPPEPGINHYNSSTSDTASTFAGQIKVGLSYDLSDCVSLFAEYRWLYLSTTHYAFGSTVYPGHPVTSNWQVKLDSQHYNLGAVGIQFSM